MKPAGRSTTPRMIPALLMALLAAPLGAQQAAPRVGQPAPRLTITEYLSAPGDAPRELRELRGGWVVVDFWAAWCARCVAGIPHMNRLADRLAEEGFTFVTLSADPRKTLERVFGRRPSRTWVARDRRGATARRYGVVAYPMAVVIDPGGIIRARVAPGDLTASGLLALARRGESP